MTATADLPGFYRGALNLWVEDPLTRDYLREVWQNDPLVVFYVSGGSDGILAVLKEAEAAGLKNVFAYADRDFRPSNRADWNNASKTFKRFVASVHEVENFLLDENAIAACGLNSLNRAPADILARLRQRAQKLTWWMACRSVLAQISESVVGGFPGHPKCPQIPDQTSAENYILSNGWFANLNGQAAMWSPNEVRKRVARAHALSVQQCANGSWKLEFSGKELFRDIRGWVYTAPRSVSSSTLDADLAKSVGQWQAQNGQVPAELTELLAALKAR